MPIASNDPLVSQYATSTAKRFSMGRLSSSPQPAPVLQRNVTPGGGAPAASPQAAAAEQSTATPPGQPSSMSGEWTMPGITDPSWFGVSRAYQLQADTANQNAQLQRSQVEAQAGMTRGDIQYAGENTRRDIGSDAEGRGIFRSGEYERNLAEQMRQEQSRLNQLDLSTTGAISGIEQQLATTMAGMRTGFAEKAQTATQQQYVRDGIQQAQQEAIRAATPQAGTAVGPNGQPVSGLFLDDQGNYYQVNGGKIVNVGLDVVNKYGMGAFQKLDPANSKDFRTAAGVTW